MAGERVAAGADIGATNLRVALVREDGELLARWREKIASRREPEAVAAMLADGVERVCRATGISSASLVGIGAGIAAQLYGTSGQVAVAPNFGWRDVDFGSLARRALGRPVEILNDVDAAALGEVRRGAAQGLKEVLVVFAGSGIGAGLVVNGRLVRGATGVAGEIGHLKVRRGGRECGCGQKGCLEAYLGGSRLSARLRHEAMENWPELLAAADGRVEEINPGTLDRLAESGDLRAQALREELAEMFGLVLANAVTLLNPAALVLGGTVLEGCPGLRQRAQAVLLQEALAASRHQLRLLGASLGDDAGVVGAASYVLEVGS